MTDIFISYSRKDIAFARLLHQALTAHGLETWIDWQDIPPSIDWLKEVYAAIEQSDTFIFILSESSTISDICNLEIEHARKNNKRLIPIVFHDVAASSVHPALAALNWIFSRSEAEFQRAITDLITAIRVDFDWVKAHTRLQVRALEWERASNDKSFLLRGSDLSQAEEWFSKAAGKSPEPSLLQTQYLQISRQEAVKRQRLLLLGVGAALIVSAILGVLAVINAQRATANAVSLSTQVVVAQNAEATAEQEAFSRATQQAIAEEQRAYAEEQQGIAEAQTEIAIEQRNLAVTRQLVSESLGLSESNYELALLLSLEASNLSPGSSFTTGNILRVIQSNSRLLKLVHLDTETGLLAFRPDGKVLASLGGPSGQTIILWDVSAPDMIPRQISRLSTGSRASNIVDSLAFSPSGEILALESSGSTITLWDVSSPEEPKQIGMPFKTDTGLIGVYSLAFGPGGQVLASGIPGQVVLWDVSMPGFPRQIGEPLDAQSGEGPIKYVAFSPDGRTLYSCSMSSIVLWDVRDLESPKQLGQPLEKSSNMALSHNGMVLASGQANGTITLWDVQDPALPIQIGQPLGSHSGGINSLAFSPDGKTLASTAEEYGFSELNILSRNSIILWDLSTPEAPTQIGEPLRGHRDPVDSLAFSPGGEIFASGSSDNTLILWDGSISGLPKRLATALEGHSDVVGSLDITGDGKTMASGSSDNTIRFWDIGDADSPRQIGQPLTGHTESVYSVDLSPNGELLASGSVDETIILWDVRDPQAPKQIGQPLTGHETFVKAVAFSPDGQILASGDLDNKILLWNVRTPEAPERIGGPLPGHTNAHSGLDKPITSLSFSPDGRILASGSRDSTIILWDISVPETPTQIGEPMTHSYVVECIAFSPDGRMLASGAQDNRVILWDVSNPDDSRRLAPPLDAHLESVSGLAFSPDGLFLASGSFDNRTIVWDISTPESPLQMGDLNHRYRIESVAFSPDGQKLASGGGDGRIVLWDFGLERWKSQACRIVGRNLTKGEWARYLSFEPYRQTCPEVP